MIYRDTEVLPLDSSNLEFEAIHIQLEKVSQNNFSLHTTTYDGNINIIIKSIEMQHHLQQPAWSSLSQPNQALFQRLSCRARRLPLISNRCFKYVDDRHDLMRDPRGEPLRVVGVDCPLY